ncbi:ABC transporter ATP-binding protein [Niabella aurantiaca]|uniref:ABC transporter ATP-binding protein n=1 Tax=Niabella aurantiaca TaxID=379900 RepID=UPI0003727213|nr:ABC transporter ATP-binding protein [Niabella aurantiaca]
MEVNFKHNFLGYFRFYHSVLGNKVYLYLCLNVLMGLLDGIGLTLFIPLFTLLFSAGNEEALYTGKMHYLTDFFSAAGIPFTITSILILVILTFSVKGFVRFLQQRYLSRMRFLFIRKIRTALLQSLNDISYTGFLKLNAGKIQNTLTTEITGLFNTMTTYFNSMQHVGILATYYVLAFMANMQFAALVIISGALSNLIFKRLFSKTQKLSTHASKKGNDFNSYLIQSVTHFRYLKATNYFKRYMQKLKKVIEETEALHFKMGTFSALSEGIKEPVAIIAIGAVLCIQFYFFPESDKNTVLVSLLLFYRSLSQLSQLQTSWQFFAQNNGSIRSVTEIVRQVRQLKEETRTAPGDPVVISGIRLSDVSVTYGKRTILEGVNLQINRNQTIAFVGESGSGKTTLANVIIGLIPPTTGNVWIGATPINELDLNAYRDKIGYITQDPVVFSDTIFNNVTFFDPPTPDNRERFHKALYQASLADFVNALPDKENTQVGDNGIYISGGQKQRLSIARELYKEVSLLILDEATSALDSATENIIQASLERLHGHCTIIIIAHRLATIKRSDTIYLLKNRTLYEQGSFEELSCKSEVFKKMIADQQF